MYPWTLSYLVLSACDSTAPGRCCCWAAAANVVMSHVGSMVGIQTAGLLTPTFVGRLDHGMDPNGQLSRARVASLFPFAQPFSPHVMSTAYSVYWNRTDGTTRRTSMLYKLFNIQFLILVISKHQLIVFESFENVIHVKINNYFLVINLNKFCFNFKT